jgi:translocation and assembly module TamB
MRFKSVLGAFIFVALASLFAFIIFVQTKSFGKLVSRVATDLSQKKANMRVSIKNIEVSFFPPGLELNKVVVSKQLGALESFNAEFGKLGFYINLIEIEERKLSFGEIRISDSVIDYKFPKKEDELKEINQDIIDSIFDLSKKLPVRIDSVVIENSIIIANHELLEAKRLKLFKKDDSFIARFHLSNIKPSQESAFVLDEVWADAEITRKNIHIYRLKIQHDVQTLLVKGEIKDFRLLKNATAELNGESHIHLKNLNSEFEFPEIVKIKRGNALLNFNLKYDKGKLSGLSKIALEDFRSNLFFADRLDAALNFENQKIILEKLDLIYKKQSAHLNSPAIVADLERKLAFPAPVHAHVENVTIANAIRILGPKFKILKGRLTGDLTFTYDEGDLYFHPENHFAIHNLRLVVGDKKKPFKILEVKKTIFEDAEIGVVKGEFRLSANADLGRSKLEIDGFVNKKEARFSVLDAQVNLLDFGNISKLDIKGEGKLSIDVQGPLDDVHINLRGKTKGFEILGYRLGAADKDITIALKDSSVIINRFETSYRSTELSGSGVVNYDNSDIALGITTNSTNMSDIYQILHPVLTKVDFLPEDLNFTAKVDVDIYGKTKLNELKIKSDIKFKDFSAYGESFNQGAFKFEMINQELRFLHLEAQKGDGDLSGDFTFSMPNKFITMNYKWENFSLSSFNIAKKINLNIDGLISGSVKGKGNINDYVLNIQSKMFNTHSQSYKFDDSDLTLRVMPKSVKGNFSFIGESLVSNFDISLLPGKKSELSLQGNLTDIKPLASAFFGQHLEQENLKGQIAFTLETKFSNTFKDLELKASLDRFVFDHADFKVDYASKAPEFVIQNGQVKEWNLDVKQTDLFVHTKGSGHLDHDLSLVHEVHVNSKILRILFAPVLAAEGFLDNIIKIDSDGKSYDVTVLSKATNLNLSIAHVPFPLNDMKYSFELINKRLFIKELTMGLDNGTASLKGDIFFDDLTPDINVRYDFDRAEIPILGKSSMNISGEGTILGNNPPYNLNGDLLLNKVLIVNELSDFESKSASMTDVRYLPKNQDSPVDRLINLNVNVKSENLARITNSLMDLGLKGEVRVLGSPIHPRGEGKLSSPVGASKVYFKNNEYFITNADFHFVAKKPISNPDFDIQALTTISNYKVYAKAYGDLEKFNFDLSSEPALSRNSILSLIAFGYTDDQQSSLGQDKDKLAGMGVGSFVFDRFKVSDILNKQFGLQLNLGSVIEQSQTASMLSGRGTQTADGSTVGRTRSATKIELRKRLDEALSVSVSSTLGSGIGQRQRMDLTYSVNKKVQLQGIYEIRSNQDGEEDIIDNSIGGDLKFRWTFK